MKSIKRILFLSTLAMMFASCGDKEEYTPGGPENGNPYDVYFMQPKTTSFSLEPGAPTTLEFTARRVDSTEAITVPVNLLANNDVSKDIFSKTELTFPAGVGTTNITVSFPGIEDGVSYSATLEISDPDYIHIYSDRIRSIRFSVVRVKWNIIGKAKFADNWTWGPTEYECDLEQSEANTNQYRLHNAYKEALVAEKITTMDGFAPSEYIYFTLRKKGDKVGSVTITKDDLVTFENYYTGEYNSNYKAPIMVVSPKSFASLNKEESWTFSKVLKYQDNGLPGIVQLAPYYYMNGVGGWNKTQVDGMILITFPGYIPVDYTVTVEQDGYSENGKVPVAFSFGTDITKLRYVVREGLMSDVAAGKLAETLKDDATAVEVNTQETLTLDLGETGVYTVVAAGYDKDGVMQGFGQGQIRFVKNGDDKGVVLTGGLFVSDKFASDPTMTSKNSVQVYIYGADITDANFAVVKTSEYLENEAEIKKELAGKSVKSNVLDAINGNGYSTVVKGLESGTSYTLVIRATNGYAEKYVTYEATTK